jgi:L-histidine Nalpha-methyltransferase
VHSKELASRGAWPSVHGAQRAGLALVLQPARAMRYRLDVHTDEKLQQTLLEKDVRRGLAASHKSLPAKYFYDRRGSELFERITELAEYYPTRTESMLLSEIAAHLAENFLLDDLVEIGAGSSGKTRTLLDALREGRRSIRYVPLDVDRDTLASSAVRLLDEYPALRVHAVVGDFERDLAHVPAPVGRRLVLFLGSTIGNLDRPARHRLMVEARKLLGGPDDRFLLGVDLVKDVKVLEAAYNDSAGVTREFNRNILRVVNRGVDGDFQPEAFRHLAFYDEPRARIEMHLVAESRHEVRLRRLAMAVRFDAGEDIWTESSYKFTRAGVETMLRAAGLALAEWHVDPANYFGLALARPR